MTRGRPRRAYVIGLLGNRPNPNRARTPDTGLVRPYRPRPDDFRQTYIQMGWDGIVEHYNTNWRVIRRWIIEEGAADLRAARAAYVAANGRKYLK